MSLVCGVPVAGLKAAPTYRGRLSSPLEQSGITRGAAAAGFDPAGAASVSGVELTWRGQWQNREAGSTPYDSGLLGMAALGSWRLGGGYEWLRLSGQRRASYGVGLAVAPWLTLGAFYRHHHAGAGALTPARGGYWDVGVLWEPASWLALTLGCDAVDERRGNNRTIAPVWRAGAALRPWRGQPWLTLGAQTYVAGVGQKWAAVHGQSTKLFAEAELASGWRTWLSWQHDDLATQLWAGVSLAWQSAALDVGGGAVAGRAGTTVAATWRSERRADSVIRERGRTVYLPLQGKLMAASPFEGWQGPAAIPTISLTLAALARDATVSTVVLPVAGLQVGLATVDDLRQAIQRLRAAGKRVIAELSTASQNDYLVAAACDTVRMDGAGSLQLAGFAVAVHYWGAALERFGVRFDAVTVGRYKSAPDQLTRREPRLEEREMRQELLAQARQTLVRALQEQRHLHAEQIAAVLQHGLFTGAEALAFGLVDALTPAEWFGTAGPSAAAPPVEPVAERAPTPATWASPASPLWGPRPVIRVIPVVGTVAMRAADNPLPGATAAAEAIVAALEEARGDSRVKAVVLRIDSPGGDVFASEVMWRAVRQLRAVKPVVVSMSDLAASGGYYVAAAADAIVAQPNTITGSIGIFALHPDLSGLLEKTRVHTEVYKSDAGAGWHLYSSPLDAAARARLERHLSALYATFVDRVAMGRHLTTAQVERLGEGRVFSGEQARAVGLVDRLGDLSDAIGWAQERAGLAADAAVKIEIALRPPLWSALVQRAMDAPPWGGHLGAAGGGTLLLESLERLRRWQGRALALLASAYEVQP